MRPTNDPGIRAWCGKALRLHRIAAGYSIERLAAKIGVGKSTIARWEKEENAPRDEHVELLAELLEVPARSFARQPKLR